jgi:hypothetical protein
MTMLLCIATAVSFGGCCLYMGASIGIDKALDRKWDKVVGDALASRGLAFLVLSIILVTIARFA